MGVICIGRYRTLIQGDRYVQSSQEKSPSSPALQGNRRVDRSLHLAAEGDSVVVNYSSSREGADRVVGEIKGNGEKAIAVQADPPRKRMSSKLSPKPSRPSARSTSSSTTPASTILHRWKTSRPSISTSSLILNVLGLVLASQEAAKLMTKGGSIVNISSVVSTLAPPNSAVYSATKASVDAITKGAGQGARPEEHPRQRMINPGMVETEGVKAQGINESDMHKQIEAANPARKNRKTRRHRARLAVFFASDDSRWITLEETSVHRRRISLIHPPARKGRERERGQKSISRRSGRTKVIAAFVRLWIIFLFVSRSNFTASLR